MHYTQYTAINTDYYRNIVIYFNLERIYTKVQTAITATAIIPISS